MKIALIVIGVVVLMVLLMGGKYVGVRNDLGLDPAYPEPLPYFYTIADALPWISTTAATQAMRVLPTPPEAVG